MTLTTVPLGAMSETSFLLKSKTFDFNKETTTSDSPLSAVKYEALQTIHQKKAILNLDVIISYSVII